MKKAGKILSAALAGLMAISGLSMNALAADSNVHSSEASNNALWADGNPNVASADRNSLDVIKWFSENDKGNSMNNLGSSSSHYYLLMPTTADLNNLTLWHTFSSNPKINGTEIQNGKSTSAIHGTGDYTMTVGSDKFTLTVMQSKFIGSMYIATESGNMRYVHEKKGNAESGNILVVEADGKEDYNGVLSHIKGRGNTTWDKEKKPYNIKLDKKASILGMDESKKWCLLANAQEHTMLRNKIAFDIGDEVGLDYSPDSDYVDLYLNGEYAGVYQVSEKVEEGKNNLVKINELTDKTEKLNDNELDTYRHHSSSDRGGIKYYDIPNNPDDITGGYLLEWEVRSKYDEEPSGFVTNRGQYVVVKGPEYASKEQVQYISKFVQEMEDALYSNTGKNSLGKHYTEYLDIESAALMYLIEEFSVDIDSGITSCFFYKDSDEKGDGKIHAAPLWDFDVAFGNLTNNKDGVNMTDAEKWFASKAYQYDNGQPTIFAKLFEHSDFIAAVKTQYNTKFKTAIDVLLGKNNSSGKYVKSLSDYKAVLDSSVAMNFVRWDIEKNRLVDEEGKTYQSQFNYLKNFITKRAAFFETNIPKLKAYDPNNTDFVVYFADVLNWNNVYIHYWGGNSSTEWPGKKMTEIGNGIYKFDLGAVGEKDNGKVQIVINNGLGKGKQTVDLNASDGILYTPNSTPVREKQDAEAYKYYYECKETIYSDDESSDTDTSTDTDEPKDTDTSTDTDIPKDTDTSTDTDDSKDTDTSTDTDDSKDTDTSTDTSEPKKLLGDVDDDGKITAADALSILRASVKLEEYSNTKSKLADVDGDGDITSVDALEVLRYSVGIRSKYSIGEAA